MSELGEKCSNTPVYLCSECDYLAECIHDFNDHTHSVDDNNDEENGYLQCNFCDEAFETLSEVMEHKKLIHTSHVHHCKNFLENVCIYENSCWFLHSKALKKLEPGIVTAQQQPQPQRQNNHNCSWVETKYSLGTPPPPTTTGTQNYMIEQK